MEAGLDLPDAVMDMPAVAELTNVVVEMLCIGNVRKKNPLPKSNPRGSHVTKEPTLTHSPLALPRTKSHTTRSRPAVTSTTSWPSS